nr:MFS transporter [Paenibacillus xylanexedens]
MNIIFYPYWAAKTLLSFIHVLYIMVITLLVYGQTGSVLYAVLFPFIQMTARIVAALTSPWLVGRFAVAKLLIGIPVAKTLMFTGIAISLPYLALHIPFLLAVITVLSFLEGWESLVLDNITPRLAVQDEELAKTKRLLSFSSQTATIVGYAIAGLLVSQWEALQTFWAAAAMSWASLTLMVAIGLLLDDTTEMGGLRHLEHPNRNVLREGLLLTAAFGVSAILFGWVVDESGIWLVYLIGGAVLILSSMFSSGIIQARQPAQSEHRHF